MKIGIFGGSFNPPHKMHHQIATALIQKRYVDKVIFVPTGNLYPYKNHLASDQDRLKMLQLMIQNEKNIEVDAFELKDKVVYTYQTLRYFKKKYPKDHIYFLLGTDNLNYIDQWRQGDELLKNYDFLIIKRHTDPLLPLLEKYVDYQDHFILTDIKESSISSTKIREMIYNNKAYQKYLDRAVYSYIKEKNLYRKEERRMDFKEIIHILQKQRKTIATMESCTGGGVVNAITNLKGACEILRFSAVTYSNEFKIKMGVPKEVIDRYTVYSMETAKEMSRAITTFAESDFGVGVTGKLKVEDPNNPGGDDETVYICLYDKEHEKFYQETIKVTEDNRPRNKEQVIHTIIKMLLAQDKNMK